MKPILVPCSPARGGRLRFIISQIGIKTLIENIVSNVYFLSVVPSYHSHSVGIYGARIFFQGSNLGERVGK